MKCPECKGFGENYVYVDESSAARPWRCVRRVAEVCQRCDGDGEVHTSRDGLNYTPLQRVIAVAVGLAFWVFIIFGYSRITAFVGSLASCNF